MFHANRCQPPDNNIIFFKMQCLIVELCDFKIYKKNTPQLPFGQTPLQTYHPALPPPIQNTCSCPP